MPDFATPQPISVTINIVVGDIQIIATERTDTIVEVRPSSEARAADVRAAERTRVEYTNGRLLVKGPRQRFHIGRSESIDLTIKLPAGSDVYGETTVGEFRVQGRLGECRFKNTVGDVNLDQIGTLTLDTGTGNITVDRAVGHTSITTGTGTVQIREIDGSATIKNSNGNTTIGVVTGELQLNAATGHISIDRTLDSVTAKNAYGNVRIGEVVRGSILLESGYGKLEVGIRKGTAAWLDLRSQNGRVRNSLNTYDSPRQSDETVEVRARSNYGDITIHRSTETTQARKRKI